MAIDVRISCITSDGTDADFRIDNIGGVNPDNTRWKLTIDEAINGINILVSATSENSSNGKT